MNITLKYDEEGGAGAKSHRVPITMRNGEEWWIYED